MPAPALVRAPLPLNVLEIVAVSLVPLLSVNVVPLPMLMVPVVSDIPLAASISKVRLSPSDTPLIAKEVLASELAKTMV